MKKLFVLTASLMLATFSHAVILSVNGVGDIEADTTITVTAYEEDPLSGTKLMEVKGKILCSASQLKVELTRSEAGLDDQLCLGQQCTPGDAALTQEMNFAVSGLMDWYTHYSVVEGKTYTIAYKFMDGETPLTLTIIYDAQAQAVENVYATSSREGVYTIFGQQLRADNSTEGLPAGMYIIGGKKQIIK